MSGREARGIAPERILVVDDDERVCQHMAGLLRDRWQVEAVTNGRDALELARALKPDLVVTDVVMPDLDGFGLLDGLRASPETATIPVIMVSARTGDDVRIEGLEAGADDYIVKPFSSREFVSRIAMHLELRRLEARLRVERAAIAELFARTPIPITVFRGPELVYEVASPSYLQAMGGRDILGKPMLAAIPELAGQGLDEIVRTVMQSGDTHVASEYLLRVERGGELQDTYWTFVCAPLRGERGAEDVVIAICNEVTEQIYARRRLERLALEADAASRAKDEFLAILGHELRNPLSPIRTALQIMRLRGINSPEQDVIERQVGHLMRLVDDLLDVSRITRGKVELRKQGLEIATIIVQAIEMTSPLLEQRAQRVELDVAASGLGVDADPVRITQVFANLITNAAKYSEPGSRIHVSAHASGRHVCVHVRDEGVGLAPEMLDKVFELFVQEPQTIERSRGGLGLGLAISRSLVELHGGRISVHSEGLGRGTDFIVELPAIDLRPSRPQTPVPVIAHDARGHGRRVLVVDDNHDAARTLKIALEEIGFTVEVAYDGPGALALATSFSPDIALLDIGLPVMDGYELARRVRALLGDAVRLIAVTGYGQDADLERSSLAGFEAHLVKPVDLERLGSVVQAFGR